MLKETHQIGVIGKNIYPLVTTTKGTQRHTQMALKLFGRIFYGLISQKSKHTTYLCLQLLFYIGDVGIGYTIWCSYCAALCAFRRPLLYVTFSLIWNSLVWDAHRIITVVVSMFLFTQSNAERLSYFDSSNMSNLFYLCIWGCDNYVPAKCIRNKKWIISTTLGIQNPKLNTVLYVPLHVSFYHTYLEYFTISYFFHSDEGQRRIIWFRYDVIQLLKMTKQRQDMLCVPMVSNVSVSTELRGS